VSVAIKAAGAQLAGYATFFSVVLISNSEAIESENAGSWILLAALAAIAPVLVLDIVWWINKSARGGRRLSTRESIVFSVATATAFAFAEVAIARALALTLSSEPLIGVPVTIVVVSVIGIGLMVLLQARRLEDDRRVELLEEGIAVELARLEVGEIVHQLSLALQTDIDGELESARIGLEERLKDQERVLEREYWPAIADELRLTAETTVRPLSRSLWSRTVVHSPRLGLIGIIRNVITQQPFRPGTVVLVYLIATTAEAITILGATVGMLTLATGVVLVSVLLVGGNAAMAARPDRHASIFVVTIILVETAGLLSFPVRDRWGSAPFTWGEFIASAILGTVVIIASSALGSIRNHRDDIARTFRSDINHELIESLASSRQVARLAREAARILHGTVQTRLIACAVAIERATKTHDVTAFRTALGEAHTVLAGSMSTASEDLSTLLEEVERKVSLWSGLCRVDLYVDPSIGNSQDRMARDAGRVVEEGLSNAIRHGNASVIRVEVSRIDDAALVVVEDNGSGPTGAKPGLGSSLLDSVSADWSLSGDSSGATLRVLLRNHPA